MAFQTADRGGQAAAPRRYRWPTAIRAPLPAAPVLASWDRHDHPSQKALTAFLDTLEPLVRPTLAAPPADLALALEVGLPATTPLTSGGRDLDNYLFPIAARFGPARFTAVFARKHHGPSALTIGPAMLEDQTPVDRWSHAAARVTASSATTAWKQQLADALAADPSVQVLPAGPVALHLGFRVSPQRNWATLWKPAVDALGGLLGLEDPARRFHPRDDRIVELGLQQVVDLSIGHAVDIDIWWRPAGSRSRRWPFLRRAGR